MNWFPPCGLSFLYGARGESIPSIPTTPGILLHDLDTEWQLFASCLSCLIGNHILPYSYSLSIKFITHDGHEP